MKSVFFVPVFNQIHEFPRVLEELKIPGLPCDAVLLINNGSSDGTEELIRNSGFEYIDLPSNRGIGYSYVKSLDWAIERDFEIFGGLAGNGKMLPSEMHQILEPLLKDEADYVTGSRFFQGGESPNLPTFRKRSIPLVNIFVKVLTGESVTDATCGYRAFKLDLIRRANFDWHAKWLNTYEFEYYLYAKMLRDRSIRCQEVPITMRYPKSGPYSKIAPFSDWWRMLKPWIIARIDGKGFAS